MPTTDTFIIPPMEPAEEPKKEKQAKKKSGSYKIILFAGLILLIITLPVAIYFITQRQQLADTRSRAATALVYQCSGGETRCQTNADGTNTGYMCTCASTAKGREWSCGNRSESCPTGTANTTGSTTGTRSSPDGTAGGCGYIQKPALSGLKPCDESTCGMNCGVYTYDCGQLCFDKACGGAGCASGGGVGAQEEVVTEELTATPEPTATLTPTTTPTAAPTSAPNSSQCDASCSTNNDCVSGLTCSSVDGVNRCRNASCAAESTCTCPGTTSTPEPTSGTTTDNTEVTGQEMPTSGVGPGFIGTTTVIGSVLLLIAGLAF